MTNIPVFPITGVAAFDYFFTLIFTFGLISVVPTLIFKLFKY